jgi:hypothetical protein
MVDYRFQEVEEPQVMIRELDHRRSDGIEVTLLWNVRTNAVSVSVMDEQDDVAFQFRVAPADAIDAFHHPYAYAPRGREGEARAA